MPEDIRLRFASCGEDVYVDPSVQIEHPERFHVGNRVRIMRNVTFIQEQAEVRIGDDCTIYPNTFVQGRGRLILEHKVDLFPNTYISIGGAEGLVQIGHNTHFAVGCAMYGAGRLVIGPNCAFAAHTVLPTVAHNHRVPGKLLVQTGRRAPITIEGDVWTGANSTILPGVTVARGCVIGANAVLTKDTEPYGVYLGVPARLAYFREREAGAAGTADA